MDLTTQQLLKKAVALHASDIFIVAGRPASIRLNGSIIIENTERLMPDDTHLLLKQIYQLADDRDMDTLIPVSYTHLILHCRMLRSVPSFSVLLRLSVFPVCRLLCSCPASLLLPE